VAEASRAVAIAATCGDDHELMLLLEELAACQDAAGDLRGALASARKVKAFMWAIHQRQTRQLVEETWARVGLERDRRDLRTRVAEATRSAEEDALTGIGNRRLLERILGADAAADADLAVIVVDVDHFKPINDTLGHDVGDRVLCALAQLLQSSTRAGQWPSATGAMSSCSRFRESARPPRADSLSGSGAPSPVMTGRPSRPAFTSPPASESRADWPAAGRRSSRTRTRTSTWPNRGEGMPSERPRWTPESADACPDWTSASLKCQNPRNGGGGIVSHPFPPRRVD
jgi:Diguanylate cyclase, GGDEF domain